MKLLKTIKLIISAALTTLMIVSCGTTNSRAKQNNNISAPEEINKRIISATGIGTLVKDGNLEGAYYRMDSSFKANKTLQEFVSDWQFVTKGTEQIVDFTVDASEYDSLHFYKPLKVIYSLPDKQITARYLYTQSSLFPTDVIYNDSAKEIEPEAVPLKDLCADYFKIGCGITGGYSGDSAVKVPQFMNIVKTEFSSCTSTNLMKPSYILKQEGSQKNLTKGTEQPALDFSVLDPTLRWCSENGVKVRGHTLVWHSQTPEWFFKEGYKSEGAYVSREVMIERLDSYIREYMTYVQTNYPGTVYCWDVVNEAVDPDNGDRATDFMCRIVNSKNDSGWYQTIGTDYPEVAFSIARKYADREAKLFYNDYGAIGKTKRQYIYNLCKSLKEKGLIDGIGIQGYWDLKSPDLRLIKEAINNYAELGLEIQLTEWSIPVKEETSQQFIEQAERYASVFKLLQSLDTNGGGNANITCVSFFGVQDHYVLSSTDKTTTRLWDKDFNPKPAYFAIQDIFKLYY